MKGPVLYYTGGATGLHRAAYCGHSDVVRLLLSVGADGGVADSDGMTPLHKVSGCLYQRRRHTGHLPPSL